MSEAIISKVSEIAEIDVQAGLKNVGGSHKAYEKVLNMLVGKVQPTIQNLEESLKNEDYSSFTVTIHGMKSVLASVGALSVSTVAADIEAASKREDYEYCKKEIVNFISAFTALGTKLESALTRPQADKKPGDDTLFHSLTEEFKLNFEQYKYPDCNDILKKMESFDFGDEYNKTVQDLRVAVDSFNYIAINDILFNIK